jgi:ribosomal protein S6E (S10)
MSAVVGARRALGLSPLALAGLVALTACGPVAKPETPEAYVSLMTTLVVSVVDESDEPLVGATVGVYFDTTDHKITGGSQRTDDTGAVMFWALPGLYYLQIDLPGYESVDRILLMPVLDTVRVVLVAHSPLVLLPGAEAL